MRIALINPMGPKNRFDDSNDQLPPLGLLSLAAAVRPRHEVCVLDGELLKRTGLSLLECLPFEPDMLGIGGTTSQAGEAQTLARCARAAFPNAKIVAGGTHATILGEEYLRQCEAFDVLVRGPGEAPFAGLADGKDPAAVPQTILRDGDGFRTNPPNGTPDLEGLAPPARDLVNLHHYPGTSHRLFSQTSIMATRGCPFRCSFCSNAVWGHRWRARPIESIIAELRVIAAMDFAEVFFQDDTLNANPDWTLELFQALREADLGLEYKVDFRANARLLPKRLLEAARDAGVREIFFGVESGNDAIRDAAGKNLPREDILRAVRAAQEHGIATLCAFIVGLPGETAETVQETIRFARELNSDSIGFSIATPFPGTELRAQAVREGLLLSEGCEALTLGVPVMRTEALTCAEVAELRDEAAREWEAHVRSRSPDAEKRIRSLEEKSCREALALAVAKSDSVGQAIISARLSRICLDSGKNADAVQFSIPPLSEPALGAYDRAKAGVILAIAFRRDGLLKEAGMALTRIETIAHPAHREWIEREWKELLEKARETGALDDMLAGMSAPEPAAGPAGPAAPRPNPFTAEKRDPARGAADGDDLARRIEALERQLSPEGINKTLRALAHRVHGGRPHASFLNERFRDYELAILNVKQLGNELGQRLARERIEKPSCRPAPVQLASKLCTQADIESDWSRFWRQEMKWAPVYHRKLWELAYVAEALYAAGQLKPGRRGLGFGCGEEPLPSLFAKYGVSIVATDLAPTEAGAQGWVNTSQHAGSLRKIRRPEICPAESDLLRIDLRFVDMNDIPRDMDGQFDFCWSVCAVEHVGSIAQGLAFIENSLRPLKPGGIAVHTTEFNLENGPTIDHWGTVLFQRAHLEELADRLSAQRHKVAPFDFSTGDGILDGFIDVPPFAQSTIRGVEQHAHLKLSVDGFPCTSAGIIIRKAD